MTKPAGNAFNAMAFRQHLHQYPELSGQEQYTAQAITRQLTLLGLAPKTGIGGNGIICTIDGAKPGQTTLLRADFDAVAVLEQSGSSYTSTNPGVMHACGHDGHTASLLQLAQHLSQQPPASGRVVLLFQPGEETGEGAAAMLQDPALADLQVDNVFAWHNLPEIPLNQIVIKPDTFACASVGASISFNGKTSHAARPENGRSPMQAMIACMDYLHTMPSRYPHSFSLVTVVHARLGEEAFGVAPGTAKVMATLRSDSNQTFTRMQHDLTRMLEQLADEQAIDIRLEWHEAFNAAVNSKNHAALVHKAATAMGLKVSEPTEPMRWSEDFAEFLRRWDGALFCIGAGESHPQLHNPDYDFPDALIDTASSLFHTLINRLHG